MPQWDINFVNGNCPFSLMLSDFLVLFPSSLAPAVVSVSLFWPMYSITTDWILLDRKYGCYILHSCISTIKGLSLSQSSLQILREVLFVHIWVSFQELDKSPVVTGVREGKTMPTLPEITLTEEEEHFSKKMACHFKGPRNMACKGISI